MNRRRILLSGTLLATLALSSCGGATGDDYVAKVDSHTLSYDQLDAITDSSTDANALRIAITNWVQVTAIGGDTSEVVTLEGLQAAGSTALADLAGGLSAEAQALYELGLDGSPVLCLRAIPLAPTTTSAEVLAELAAGLPFPEAAAKFSVDPGFADNGGVVADPSGAECIAPGSLSVELLASLAEAGAVIGTPVAITFSSSELVMVMRPFDDLAEGDRTALAGAKVNEAVDVLLGDITPDINERYGVWNSERREVVPYSGE